MFLCGFCNSSPFEEPPEIVFNSLDDARNYQKTTNSNILESQIKNSIGSIAMIKSSNYSKHLAECIKSNSHFEDKEFPPNKESLDFAIPGREITWKRISKMYPACVMSDGQICAADVTQGNIGDCYFLASLSALAGVPSLIEKIFLRNFERNGNCIYKVIASVEGVMSEVVIDDFVPVFASTNRPVFCKANGNEIWAMLLEKAWAKIKGSYGAISSGTPHEVLNTFSLAPCINHLIHEYHSQDKKDAVWNDLLEASRLKLPTCVGSKAETFLNGLKPLHTYTFLGCMSVPSNGANHRLVRMRNPWGETQYNGFANENDDKFWKDVSSEYKKVILPAAGVDDGDFVIPFAEFIKHFQSIDVCHYRAGFSYEFEELTLRQFEPTFVRLEVKQEHEAYISVEKVIASEKAREELEESEDYGYLRIIVAREVGKENYQYFNSKLQANFGDISLRCHFAPGNYMIMIEADYPSDDKQFSAILSYYYEPLLDNSNKKLSILKDKGQLIKMPYLTAVFKNHALRLSNDLTKLSARPDDWIKNTLLYEQGGYGYVACSLQDNTNFRLNVSVDQKAIKEGGFVLLTHTPKEFKIEPGSLQIYIFSINMEVEFLEQINFPPAGFKITKIV